MLSFPKFLRTQKRPFVICPVAIWFLTVVIASPEYFLRVLAKLNFYYAPFCIARRKDHLNGILVQTHCWLFIVITFSAISSSVTFQKPWNYFACHDSDSLFLESYLKLNHFHDSMVLESVIINTTFFLYIVSTYYKELTKKVTRFWIINSL